MMGRNIPNIISGLRILLVIPIVVVLSHKHYVEALLLFALAGASDGLDGYLAKHFDWKTRLGSILDPIADKLLLISVFLTLGWLGLVPAWLVIAVMARDGVILGGAIAYHFLIGRYKMSPSFVSKTNTVFQILLVLAVVSFQVFPQFWTQWILDFLIYIVLMTTVVSGSHYVWTWGRSAIREYRKTQHV